MILRDTFLEINLDALTHNISEMKKMVGAEVAVMAVIKADAYSTGAAEVVETLMENGADFLGVAILIEGLEIRKKYKNYPILVMGYTSNECLEKAIENDLRITVFSEEQAKLISEISIKENIITKIHIKYDTGLHRLGFSDNEESLEAIERISKLRNIELEGIFSHFALNSKEKDRIQFEKFTEAIKILDIKGVTFKYKHMCDGISTIERPEYRLNMVRPGAPLYGIKTFSEGDFDIKQVMTFKTRISQIHEIKKGETVGYMEGWTAEKDSLIGTLQFGYADGYPRKMQGGAFVTIKDKKVQIVGFLCMDQCMVDLTEVPLAKVGDEVIIFGDGKNNTMTTKDIAIAANTGQNDIITRIGRRTPRIYKKNNQIIKSRYYLLD